MENLKEITNLLYKHIRKELSDEESIQLQNWVNESEENRIFFAKATDVKWLLQQVKSKSDSIQHIDLDQAWEAIKRMGWEQVSEPKRAVISLKYKRYVAVAAAVLLLIVASWFFGIQHPKKLPAVVPSIAKVDDVQPGKYKAMLTLADGRTIALDTAIQGELAKQGNSVVLNKDGRLVYDDSKQSPRTNTLENSFNTLQTTKGQTYTTVLADGSQVWLNSESSIRYPIAFTGSERKVYITGEAYFEVAPAFVQKGNKLVKQPFKVVVENMEVEVLGTHFNVNAYADEEVIKTTLLEGKVKIVTENISSVLTPGQQAQLKKGTTLLQVMDNADVEQAVAWKNGFFQFSDDDLKTVMRQLARWYDVEVIYQGGITSDTYGGRINRNSKVSEVLTLLGRNRVKYKIEGKKIIIAP
jgi:ferric-dicitrate binding protein FerR (iron transport regulator)